MTRIAYLVTYSTGSYDTFYIHNDKVFLSKEKALKRCAELNELHKGEISPFERDRNFEKFPDKDQPVFWYIEYEVEEFINNNPDKYPRVELDISNFSNRAEWEKCEDYIEEQREILLKEKILEYYPTWTEEDIEKAIEIEENNQMLFQEEYDDAEIEEIEIDLDE